jgi:hypothetical protein
MAFTALAMIASVFIEDGSANMTNEVAVHLQNDHAEPKPKQVEA